MLKTANTDIKMAMYKISRCVDAGNFHKEIQAHQTEELTVTECIPLCCKIELEDHQMPLTLVFSKIPAGVELKTYVSFRNPEPSARDCDQQYFNQQKITIVEEQEPKEKNQKSRQTREEKFKSRFTKVDN